MGTKQTYRWRFGFYPPKGIAADIARSEMERIRNANEGQLTPDALVEESVPETAPLHNAFEWNNAKAGRAWRRQQAMQMIRSVEVVYSDEEKQPHREYVLSTVEEDTTAYMPMRMVARDADLLADAMERLKRELAGARASIRELQTVATREGKTIKGLDRARKHIDNAWAAVQ